ncbi:GNAT family N-acetyltransferase [Ornithinibacillus sp. L9]|uniref:GNAT family N-acetyltransferase n=1 Tax=Ornithinibacillus caprae TaxID=2678566 RepID=A0A6N8FKY5_9BACI|nr:GNAT family N-acetyltransferase [Ornithinibacillus caprae]MUK87958.1 GNAT family N-acetyltransferase [Ornithinibacillus caprae]
MTHVTLEYVEQGNRKNYIDYLLLADESEEVINKYIQIGDMFSVYYKDELAGVVLFTFDSNEVVELKNIALAPPFRRLGIGKRIVAWSLEHYKREGQQKMIVGTANSSIGNIAFYQKVGFRMVGIKKDFFNDYPNPIYEDGIQALDMVMFEKQLRNIRPKK